MYNKYSSEELDYRRCRFSPECGILLWCGAAVIRESRLSFYWKEVYQELFESRKKIIVAGFVWLLLAISSVYAMVSVQSNEKAELNNEFIGVDGRKAILLEPEIWIGKEFPLFSRFVESEGSEILKKGTWNVVLTQPDCPKCQEMKADLQAKNAKGIAIVVINSRNERVPDTSFLTFRLDNRNDWFVTTPCVVKISDGICEEINEKIDKN